MGKTSDLFKKIRDTKGTIHAKTGTVQEKNCKDLTEAQIKNRWQEYTEMYKKGDNDRITMMAWPLTQSQTSWSLKLNGPQEALL